jgi:tRNA-dihydrouridine synthase 1
MLHPTPFAFSHTYRQQQLVTDAYERTPMIAQFCATPSEAPLLARAASIAELEHSASAIDLNLGCPTRNARKLNFGSSLMEHPNHVFHLLRTLHDSLSLIPTTVKIRCFDTTFATVEYAQMLERAGASLIAVHGRTRAQTNAREHRADWDKIAAVKSAVGVPVLGNGDCRCRADADAMMAETGVDGVLSAEPLLRNPALFHTDIPVDDVHPVNGPELALELLDIVRAHPEHQPPRFVRDHVFKLCGSFLEELTTQRDKLARAASSDFDEIARIVREVKREIERIESEEGRKYPIPAKTRKQLECEELERRKQAGIREEQEQEQWLEAVT